MELGLLFHQLVMEKLSSLAIADPKVGELINSRITQLASPDEELRAIAALTLGGCYDQSQAVIPLLINMTRHDVSKVARLSATSALISFASSSEDAANIIARLAREVSELERLLYGVRVDVSSRKTRADLLESLQLLDKLARRGQRKLFIRHENKYSLELLAIVYAYHSKASEVKYESIEKSLLSATEALASSLDNTYLKHFPDYAECASKTFPGSQGVERMLMRVIRSEDVHPEYKVIADKILRERLHD
jgi:hypothetical protein